MLPTFILIGSMKSGTSTLHWQLTRHPDVFMTMPKEPRFFNEYFERGLPWYERLFDSAAGAVARGEASTDYTAFPKYPETPARIASVVPDVRLIYLVRDPVARMRSHYLHRVGIRRESRPVEEALFDYWGYLNQSRYGMQVERYLQHFPREQLMIVRAEEMFAEPEQVLPRVFDFIGVDSTWSSPDPGHRENGAEKKYQVAHPIRRVSRAMSRTRIYNAIPQQTRKSIARAVSRSNPPPVPQATISPELRAKVLDELADDLELFTRLTGDTVPV